MSDSEAAKNFLAIYNQLDEFMHRYIHHFEDTDRFYKHKELIFKLAHYDRLFAIYKEDLLSFADLRNLLEHNPYIKQADPFATPHAYILKRYEEVKTKLLQRPQARDVAVTAEKIYTTNLEAPIFEVLRVMTKHNFSHVPVMDKAKFIGVFSENIVVYYLSSHQEINALTKVSDLSEYLSFDNHPGEYFAFVAGNAPIDQIQDLFIQDYKNHKRLAVVYVTESGKSSEPLKGLITAWDLAGEDFII